MLFAIYINDLDINTLNLIISLFADDGAGWPRHLPRQSYLSQYKLLVDFLTHVQEWSDKWELDFSLTKTQILLVVNKHYPSLPRRPNSPEPQHRIRRPIQIPWSYLSKQWQMESSI